MENTNPYLVKFRKPHTFENETHDSVDLSGLENLTAQDMIDADRIFLGQGNIPAMNEMTVGYSMIIASKASNKPLEFFNSLKLPDATAVKGIVTNFLFGEV